MTKRTDAVRVGLSQHGWGTFAARRFKKRAAIGQVTGQVIHDPDYSSDYCMDLGDGKSLEPGEPFRFLNHSCEPNCELVLIDVEREDGTRDIPEIWLETLRPIASGEELTIDYGWPMEHGIPCQCGSPRCRGWIVAQDDRPKNREAVTTCDEPGLATPLQPSTRRATPAASA